jgi:hypothetical protein
MGPPASRFHEGLQTGSYRPLEQGDDLGGFGVFAALLAGGLFRARPCFNPTGRLCAAPLGFRCCMAFQIRPTATRRLVNLSTGCTPGRLFQTSTRRPPGHLSASAANSSWLVKVSVPSPLPWLSFREAKAVMLFSESIVNTVMLFLSDAGRLQSRWSMTFMAPLGRISKDIQRKFRSTRVYSELDCYGIDFQSTARARSKV